MTSKSYSGVCRQGSSVPITTPVLAGGTWARWDRNRVQFHRKGIYFVVYVGFVENFHCESNLYTTCFHIIATHNKVFHQDLLQRRL
mmetsp:Transcript_104382/g.145477  ORF Transcript_104382/g.145477 Transcript_104382/m.145477 type:complete len:86 (+) Transcript_104382:3-260(+)